MKPTIYINVDVKTLLVVKTRTMSPQALQQNGLVIKLKKQTNKNTNMSTLLKVFFVHATCTDTINLTKLQFVNEELTFMTLGI
jgi:hypothetical protein